MAQQYSSAPVLPPDAQVVKDTSMAETQRKAAKDEQDGKLAQAKIQAEALSLQAKLQAEIQVENAKITGQPIPPAPPTPGQPPAGEQMPAQPQPAAMMPPQGVPNGNV
jgi:hypothetical protein